MFGYAFATMKDLFRWEEPVSIIFEKLLAKIAHIKVGKTTSSNFKPVN